MLQISAMLVSGKRRSEAKLLVPRHRDAHDLVLDTDRQTVLAGEGGEHRILGRLIEAQAIPMLMRSRSIWIISRSNSANTPHICRIALPAAVVQSPMPRACGSCIVSSSCSSERPKRSRT